MHDLRQQTEHYFHARADTMKRTQQTLFFQFTDKELSELPRIALQLKREGFEILELIGRKKTVDVSSSDTSKEDSK